MRASLLFNALAGIAVLAVLLFGSPDAPATFRLVDASGALVLSNSREGAALLSADRLVRDPALSEALQDAFNAGRVPGALIEAEIRRRPNAEWEALLAQAGIPCAPVQNVQQMLEHEQTRALGLVQPVPGSSVPLIGLPLSFDGLRPQPRAAAPALGADTEAVLGPFENVGRSTGR
jgi:crotonobetainyl-CoA:carnitine CoA-transferase CaiB-like acyl-CoA transferase